MAAWGPVAPAPLPLPGIIGDGSREAALAGISHAALDQITPRLSVILQYYRMSKNIEQLSSWRSCPGIELLVHMDSRDQRDLAWLNTTANRLLIDPNIHEIRGYNALARLARAPLIAFVQDDMPPPLHCEYLESLEQMLVDDPALAAVGWRTWSMTPMNYRWVAAFGRRFNATGAMRFERRVNCKLNWWRGSTIRAQYAALVDVGPLFVRATAFAAVGGFNEGFSVPGHNGHYHDWEFSTRLWLHGWRAAFQDVRLGSGVSCVCFHCITVRACTEEACKKDVALGHTRMRANYKDVRKAIVRQRDAIMRHYVSFYENISWAVGRLNTQMAASNGFESDQGALVRWTAGPLANRSLLEISTHAQYCKPRMTMGTRCCSVWGSH